MEPDVIWVAAAAISFAILCAIALWRNRSSATGDPHASQSPRPAPDPNGSVVTGIDSSIEALLKQRRVIDAIKLYRENTGASLLEAKQAIDRLRKSK